MDDYGQQTTVLLKKMLEHDLGFDRANNVNACPFHRGMGMRVGTGMGIGMGISMGKGMGMVWAWGSRH
ncbi:hypothetical protein ANCCEY_06026 [Ancylostoma ceylanicum]|uniref:Uncharacterized protein n=1 Tax=Ancylostoma ceylanicum TaxID=53326 RepID=A0A0D6LXQ1_9BILA|nr:hypothetical protein ANCCEY_06026 [Ancylostoma ceylanicum]